MQPRIISIFSFRSLKFVSLRIGTKFILADTKAIVAELRIEEIN